MNTISVPKEVSSYSVKEYAKQLFPASYPYILQEAMLMYLGSKEDSALDEATPRELHRILSYLACTPVLIRYSPVEDRVRTLEVKMELILKELKDIQNGQNA